LQDIKVPERAGGYSYKDSSKYFTRNRFIYWRICHDVLELVEHSLDINLVNCRVRYKFTDTPILDGISIHETVNSVIILIVTVSSVHKLSFSHPDKTHNQVCMNFIIFYIYFVTKNYFNYFVNNLFSSRKIYWAHILILVYNLYLAKPLYKMLEILIRFTLFLMLEPQVSRI